jgi:hypothetical protein
MKTLIISKQLDFVTKGLAIPLTKIGELGVCQDFDKDSVDQFAPDLIISSTLYDKRYRHFDIREMYKLEPFIDLDNFNILPMEEKWRSDLVYLGNIGGFEKALTILSRYGSVIRHFDTQPSDTQFYAGIVDMSKAYTMYHYSKVCPVFDRSPYRELDIIASDGNPVFYDSLEQFVADCVNCFDGYVMPKSKSKDEIFNIHTNYDRVSSILERVGFSVEAREVKDKK